MESDNINVRVQGELKNHIKRQVSERGLYASASEYVRSLIRADIESSKEAWDWLKQHLEPGLRADESQFSAVTAQDVINRNKS